MLDFIQLLLSGTATGAIYALAALAKAMKGLTVSVAKEPGVLMDVSYDDKGDLDRASFLVEVKNGKQEVKEVLPPLGKKGA